MAIADPLAGTLRGRPHSVAFAAHVGKNASKTASAGRLQEPASRKEEVDPLLTQNATSCKPEGPQDVTGRL
jgi:hypothetical protein